MDVEISEIVISNKEWRDKPTDEPASLGETLVPIGCISVLLIILVSDGVGIITILKWLF